MDSSSTIRLTARDVSGQALPHAVTAPADGSVEELVSRCLSRMDLPRNDQHQRPITYGAFRSYDDLEVGQGENLNPVDRIGDVLNDGDTIVLEPDISAGFGSPRHRGGGEVDSPSTIRLTVRDVSDQAQPHNVKAPADSSVEELVSSCLSRMELPRNDPEKRPITYGAFRQQDDSAVAQGENLNPADRIGDVLNDGDTIVLQPDISAGDDKQ